MSFQLKTPMKRYLHHYLRLQVQEATNLQVTSMQGLLGQLFYTLQRNSAMIVDLQLLFRYVSSGKCVWG